MSDDQLLAPSYHIDVSVVRSPNDFTVKIHAEGSPSTLEPKVFEFTRSMGRLSRRYANYLSKYKVAMAIRLGAAMDRKDHAPSFHEAKGMVELADEAMFVTSIGTCNTLGTACKSLVGPAVRERDSTDHFIFQATRMDNGEEVEAVMYRDDGKRREELGKTRGKGMIDAVYGLGAIIAVRPWQNLIQTVEIFQAIERKIEELKAEAQLLDALT